jgi:hypothetical protein
MALSKIQSNSILDGAITAGDLASSAISDKLGFTPANSSTALTSISNVTILSTSIGNQNTGTTAWMTPSSSVYKWDLPSAGKYFLYTCIRTRIWGLTGFVKCRLYNATDGTSTSAYEKMLQEFQTNSTVNNIQLTPVWTIEIPSAKTFYLQLQSTMTGEVGIQSDSNGWNETGWIKLS